VEPGRLLGGRPLSPPSCSPRVRIHASAEKLAAPAAEPAAVAAPADGEADQAPTARSLAVARALQGLTKVLLHLEGWRGRGGLTARRCRLLARPASVQGWSPAVCMWRRAASIMMDGLRVSNRWQSQGPALGWVLWRLGHVVVRHSGGVAAHNAPVHAQPSSPPPLLRPFNNKTESFS
jgi:hypothetical protein